MPIERHSTEDGAHQMVRKLDVTASRGVPALMGADPPGMTVLKLYCMHRGVEFPEPDENDPAMVRGNVLEPSIPGAIQRQQPEWRVEPAGVYLRDPVLCYGATPDFFGYGDPRGLLVIQGKTVAPHVFDRDWRDGPPAWIEWQNTAECDLAEQAYDIPTFGVIAALTGSFYKLDCQLYEVPRDLDRRAAIRRTLLAFRADVEAGREPQPDFTKDAEAIKALAGHEIKGTICNLAGNNEIPMLLAKRAELMDRIKRDKAECEVVETELRYLMGDAEIVAGMDGWRITYRTEHRKGYTVEPSDPRVLRIYDRRERTS